MATFGEEFIAGRAASPTTYIPRSVNLSCFSVAQGDSVDSQPVSPVTDGVGFQLISTTTWRAMQIFRFPVERSEVSGYEMIGTILKYGFDGAAWTGGFTGPVQIGFYYILRPVDSALGSEVTPTHFDLSLGNPGKWAEIGLKAGVDYESVPVGLLTLDLDDYNAAIDSAIQTTNPYFKNVDLTPAWVRAAESSASDFYILAKPMWARPGSGSQYFAAPNPFAFAASPHSHTTGQKRPPLSFFGLHPDGSINRAAFKDRHLGDRSARIITGNPAPGGVGPSVPTALGNATSSLLTRVMIIRGLAYAETPSRPVGGPLLKHVHVYDNASGQGYIEAGLRIIPMPSFEPTRYQVYHTPAFGTEDGPLLTSGAANYGRYDTDTIFVYNSKNAFQICANHWVGAPMTTGQTITLDVLGDDRPAGFTDQAAERHEITTFKGVWDPGVGDDRLLPDETRWRSSFWATAQQLTSGTFPAVYNAEPEGNVSRSWIPVGDTRDYRTGDPGFITNGIDAEFFTIRAKIDRLDADPAKRDCLITAAPLAHTYGTNAVVCTGPYVGDLAAPDRGAIASPASVGAAFIELQSALRTASGVVRIYSISSDATELRSFTRSGSRLNFTNDERLENAYAVNDEVVLVENASWVPFYTRLHPEEGAVQAEQLALFRAIRFNVK